jgi:hypothetical protein
MPSSTVPPQARSHSRMPELGSNRVYRCDGQGNGYGTWTASTLLGLGMVGGWDGLGIAYSPGR